MSQDAVRDSESRDGFVWVVGSVNVDLTVRAATLPAPGETVTGGRFSSAGGGKSANQAVAAARAGAAVVFTGAVGNDDAGAAALRELESLAVDVATCERVDGVPTGVALIVVDAAGDNQIAVASGANDAVDNAYVSRAFAALPGVPAVCLLSLEIPMSGVVAAASLAADVGSLVVVNPAPAQQLPADLLALRPLLTPNAGEAQLLTGEADPDAAARALAASTGAPAVVTLGSVGVVCADGENCWTVAAPAVDAIDTTGAGDVFSGTLAARLAQGDPLRPAVTAAVQAAAASVAREGAR